jgi:hypothetical protein
VFDVISKVKSFISIVLTAQLLVFGFLISAMAAEVEFVERFQGS